MDDDRSPVAPAWRDGAGEHRRPSRPDVPSGPTKGRVLSRIERSLSRLPSPTQQPRRGTDADGPSPGVRATDTASSVDQATPGHDVARPSGGSPSGRLLARRWLLWLPTLLALVLKGIAASGGAVGSESTAVWLVWVGSHWLTFGLALLGTIALYDDATWLAAVGADWRPNPWWYILGGALSAVPVLLAPLAIGGDIVTALPVVFGAALVALPLSSIVAGPLYLAVRTVRLREEALPSEHDQDAAQEEAEK